MSKKILYEISKEGKIGCFLPDYDVKEHNINELLPKHYIREELNLPEVSEVDVVRHFTSLSNLNHGVDSGAYPLGSCTMKYNPKINEKIAGTEGFADVHPYTGDESTQGCLKLLYETDKMLSEITGMDKVSLQPAAGAHGEMTGLMIIKAYHKFKGENHRNIIIVPDSAHGTNPASATIAGFKTVEVKSNENGGVDIKALRDVVDENIAGLMLTNPNTLGLFDENIEEIASIIHEAGGLLYYDGANANAIMGISRPGDMGFDVVHLNLHKTFSTPHGMGGPGSGPVGVKKELISFLPKPVVDINNGEYYLDYERPYSIGKVKSFYGNFGVVVKAYTYILTMGSEGLRKASEIAVLNANYMMEKLKEYYYLTHERKCMHEFVISAKNLKDENGITALDVAKSLLDHGYHPPTIYFPLIIKEALMIEPTESEGKESLDEFIEVMIKIAEESKKDPEKIKHSPYNTPVRRVDEVKAARDLILKWTK